VLRRVGLPPDGWSLLIAATPRSGSWLLAEGLRSLRIAGRPEEYFAPDAERAYREKWHLPAEGPYGPLFQCILAGGRTRNGVFAVKAHWPQLRATLPRLHALAAADGLPAAGATAGSPPTDAGSPPTDAGSPPTDAAVLAHLLGPLRVVYLDRRDTLRQAVSWHRAITCNSWWTVSGEGPEPMPEDAGYDFESIKTLYWLLRDDKAAWQSWFRANGVRPLIVGYERLAADYAGTIRDVARGLGLGVPDRVPPPRLVRQSADGLNERWVREYRRCWRRVFGNGSEPPLPLAVQHQDAAGHPAAVQPPQRADDVLGR
jgi:LPS sulfotransferase NodH